MRTINAWQTISVQVSRTSYISRVTSPIQGDTCKCGPAQRKARVRLATHAGHSWGQARKVARETHLRAPDDPPKPDGHRRSTPHHHAGNDQGATTMDRPTTLNESQQQPRKRWSRIITPHTRNTTHYTTDTGATTAASHNRHTIHTPVQLSAMSAPRHRRRTPCCAQGSGGHRSGMAEHRKTLGRSTRVEGISLEGPAGRTTWRRGGAVGTPSTHGAAGATGGGAMGTTSAS